MWAIIAFGIRIRACTHKIENGDSDLIRSALCARHDPEDEHPGAKDSGYGAHRNSGDGVWIREIFNGQKVFSFPVIIEKNCCRPFVFSFLTRTHDFKNPFNPFVEIDVYKSAINFPIFKPLLINSDFV